MTQNEAILSHLRNGNKITPIEALDKFGCFRLGARIHNLKQDGEEIKSRLVVHGKKRFSEYWLEGK